jgi:hypothetical protein
VPSSWTFTRKHTRAYKSPISPRPRSVAYHYRRPLSAMPRAPPAATASVGVKSWKFAGIAAEHVPLSRPVMGVGVRSTHAGPRASAAAVFLRPRRNRSRSRARGCHPVDPGRCWMSATLITIRLAPGREGRRCLSSLFPGGRARSTLDCRQRRISSAASLSFRPPKPSTGGNVVIPHHRSC